MAVPKIGPSVRVADRPHRITLQNRGPIVPDGDGGFTQAWVDLTPAAVSAKIEPATAQNLERVAAGAAVSRATHLVSFPYHAQVTTKTRITFGARTFECTGVMNPEERNVETVCVCVEAVA